MNRIPRLFPEGCASTAQRLTKGRVSTAQGTSSRRCWPQVRAARTLALAVLIGLLAPAALPRPGQAFCGFYVATGDMRLYNRASKVVIARDGDRTVLTMSSDFRGDPKEFAVVVPVA